MSGMSGKRIKAALAVGGAGVAAALALAGTAHAAGYTQITQQNTYVKPGMANCIAVLATSSVGVAGTADAPGLKFRLVGPAQTAIAASSGPVTAWSTFIAPGSTYPGTTGWEGFGDYSACAVNNGTAPVHLDNLTVDYS